MSKKSITPVSVRPVSRKIVFVVIVILIAYVYNTRRQFDSPIIETSSGLVQGFTALSRDNREFFKFLGIPFAKPPVGPLRFQPPELPEKWEGILYAGQYGSACVQTSLMTGFFWGAEDCLYLNVFVPKNIPEGRLLPSVVWLYGGMYMEGLSIMYGAEYLMDHDVILVTLNYRVGALGFLNTNDHHIRGNMGLKDQTMALKWVQANIKAFHGDPNRVTLYGQSAGGASVHCHMLSPLSKGLFSKAISASGVANNPWAFTTQPHDQAVRFASKFCPTNNTAEMVACLQALPIRTIQDAHLESVDLLRHTHTIFTPTAEAVKDQNAFLTAHPLEYMRNGSVSKVPWLTGVVDSEGLMFTALTLTNETLLKSAIENWQYLLPRVMYLEPNLTMSIQIKEEYFGNATTISANGESSTAQLANYTNAFSDRHFMKGIHDAAILQRKHAPVYLYYMDFQVKYSIVNFILAADDSPLHPILNYLIHLVGRTINEYAFGLDVQTNGTSHTDDLFLVFDLGIPSHARSAAENEMSRKMVKMIASFATNSDKMEFGGVSWPPLDPNAPNSQPLKYMRLNLNPELIDEPFRERAEFWESLNIP